MSLARVLFSAAVVLGLFTSEARAEKAVILVRHAEKVDQSKDAALSETGKQRAQRLAQLLARTGVTHVFTSEYIRTRTTAEPLARAAKVTPVVVSAADEAALVKQIRALPHDAVVLVVGHSNTLPGLLKALGHRGEVTIADDEYGRVFMLVKREGGPALLEVAY
ncbi:MAG: phosphoglycerate mutase family protein [Myxococcota bacterium]